MLYIPYSYKLEVIPLLAIIKVILAKVKLIALIFFISRYNLADKIAKKVALLIACSLGKVKDNL